MSPSRSINIRPVGGSQKINLCLYGPTGVGKTRFLGSGQDVLIIKPPTDHTDSIRGGVKRNVQEFEVNNWDDMEEVHQYLRDEGESWQWVALDTISLMQDTGLDDLWAQVLKEKPQRARYGLDVQEYGINMHRLGLWVRSVAGIGTFNFAVTAHPFWSTNVYDEDIMMPYVQGKNMADKICGCMNMVGMMEVKKLKAPGEKVSKTRRVINFGASKRFYAKDQFDAFEETNSRLIDPTMPSFMSAVEAAMAREAAPKKKTTKKRSK